ncbi:ABC transporter permease [Anaerolinea thermophila]|uniref:Alpha-galactoside ABC transporter permease protein n=1 Tax=Anaerolinea thermophila (strain DSM 14523 / JCM 11388 / NBRC 100420 / UNI-1) TaxID=926569 RepID=E8N3A6_ANATU|nr:ABC transporter permease [Anaerolinea thermophila]BAJ62920.1 alpha-galactoside ABC transporter permease protein [Anaerolinea thermophila UNI-1]
MISYILRRLLLSIPLLLGISIVSFAIIQLPPGDFATTYQNFLINQANMSPVEAEKAANEYRKIYGLDRPVYEQYFNWIKGIVTEGKFGYSFAYKQDVGQLIAERLPRTLFLALSAHLISTIFGIVIGIYSATHKYSIGDYAATVFAFIGTAAPRFFLAIIAVYFLVIELKSPYVNRFVSPEYSFAPLSWAKFVDILKYSWPVIAIAGFGGIARNMRVMRGNLLDVLNMQYVTTARAKGLREDVVINKHAVPNALHPIIMYQGTVLPYMLQGELEAAIVLNMPSLAPMFYSSLVNQDIYVSGGFLLIYSVLLVLGNLIADVVLALVDPRIRLS